MSFDQRTRNLLQRTVSACRRILDEEFAAQRREIYGINDDGSAATLETLAHLPDEDMQVARLLRDRLQHLTAGLTSHGKTEAEARRESVARLTREQAFTVLNRLAALRMAEEREIVLECVRQGMASEGFLLFQQTAGSALGNTFETYRTYLFLLFDELTSDLGVLFSRWDPAGLLFPGKDALEAVLKELGGTGSAMVREEISPEAFNDIWSEDETVGWIYQYYNDQAERKKMREESAAPRNSRELAVRNQFFTPRYVVEFLTDNTLGRIWYEMTRGITKLKEQCRYLVRRPNEIFLKPAETAPEQPQQGNLSQEDLLKQPVFIPHRPLKDPRTILMLDPACGSMHFGLYAFDLFEVIYDEAWALEEKLGPDALNRPPGMKPLHATYAGKDAFLKDVPRLIIECNIHGIDIDPRAAQIAGLALWLRAQKAWQRLGLAPAQRPAIKRSNIVCAEPMPGEKELLREFVERKFPALERGVCLRLLEAIFDKMQLAGEAGSLLKIEEEIRSAIEDARDAWQKLATKPQELFTTTELNQLSTAPELTGLEQAVSSLTTDPRHLTTDFWERLEERIYAALRDYAEQAENGGGFQRRLFAEDAARGFAFIDVCRKRYDVALMNPPFGVAPSSVYRQFENIYPASYTELYACFVERAVMLCSQGAVGAITSRGFLTMMRLTEWRQRIVIPRISTLLDLGLGVMDDAMVRAAAYVLNEMPSHEILAVDGMEHEEPQTLAARETWSLPDNIQKRILYVRPRSQFAKLPLSRLIYKAQPSIVELFEKSATFGNAAGTVRAGLQTFDNERFVRAQWEVPTVSIGRGLTWEFFSKGGDYAKFYTDVHLVINRDSDGAELAEFNRLQNGQTAQSRRSSRFYHRPGLTFTSRSNKGLSVRAMPADCVFSHNAPAIFPSDGLPLVYLLGWANSRLIRTLVEIQASTDYYTPGSVDSLPWCQPAPNDLERVAAVSCELGKRYLQNSRYDETSALFEGYSSKLSFAEHLRGAAAQHADNVRQIRILQAELSKDVDIVYGMDSFAIAGELLGQDPDDDVPLVINSLSELVQSSVALMVGCAIGRWDIRYATGEQAAPELPNPFAPLPVCPPGQLQNAQGLPARPEDVPAAYPVRIPWDGILVDDPNHPLDLERRVREVIEIIWSGQEGGPTAESIKHEACEILGVRSVRDYFRKPAGFFADHLKRYSKSRRQAPIYWPLSTASGSYTLWIYYHRLTPDTLYKCLSDFVEPKIAELEKDIHRLRTMVASDEGGTKERKQLADAETLITELREFHADLSHWAPRWKPNLNDGVVITASPLWKLFRLPKWQKTLKETWQDLEKGDYDWAHLAHTLWPDRVREKCKKDRSLAIAHNLEELCEVKAPVPKKKAAKKAAKKKGKATEQEELL